MEPNSKQSSWVAFGLFYIVLIAMVTVLDLYNDIFRLSYWGAQIGLITVGVGILAFVGLLLPEISAARGMLLAFSVGILTIIPAVLMGLGRIPGLWPQYFFIAFGMAAGSFLTFVFIKFVPNIQPKKQVELEKDNVD